jgi:hypothetical protein
VLFDFNYLFPYSDDHLSDDCIQHDAFNLFLILFHCLFVYLFPYPDNHLSRDGVQQDVFFWFLLLFCFTLFIYSVISLAWRPSLWRWPPVQWFYFILFYFILILIFHLFIYLLISLSVRPLWRRRPEILFHLIPSYDILFLIRIFLTLTTISLMIVSSMMNAFDFLFYFILFCLILLSLLWWTSVLPWWTSVWRRRLATCFFILYINVFIISYLLI